ncbi:MAG: class I SAM-dependent methyltransferase [Candidatus Kerfeldbacteria bacterium]|nr:class I SAM-dependent methyltransferase [Candidatus Kerfeldbacteria bacterium]
MATTDDLRSTYNTVAKDYYFDHIGDTWDNDYIILFVKNLPKSARVLDLGCGPGTDTLKLKAAGLNVEGFDLSDDLLAIARKNNPAVTFTQGDMRKPPYKDRLFDGVFAKASLLHIPKSEISSVLAEVIRILKPRGLVHIAVKKGQGEQEETESDYGYSYTRFFSYWAMDELVNVLQNAGLKVTNKTETLSNSGKTTWLKIIAQKS